MNDHEFAWDHRTSWPNTLCSACGASEYDRRHFGGDAQKAAAFYQERAAQVADAKKQPERITEVPKFASVEEADAWLEEQADAGRTLDERFDALKLDYTRRTVLHSDLYAEWDTYKAQVISYERFGMKLDSQGVTITDVS